MISAVVVNAVRIRIPNDIRKVQEGTAGTQEVARVAQNDFGVKKITVTMSHAQEAIEYAWSGQMVQLMYIGTNAGDICHVAFSDTTGGEVSSAASASNNSTVAANTLKAGAPIISGERVPFTIPSWGEKNKVCYLIHEGSAAGTLYMILG